MPRIFTLSSPRRVIERQLYIEFSNRAGRKILESSDLLQRLWIAPVMAGLGKEILGGDRAPGARAVEFAVGQGFVFPAFADGIDDAPGGFDFVTADKKGGVAGERFEEEAFVG